MRLEPPDLFVRVSDDVLRENGYDPGWIVEEDGDRPRGPYAACAIDTTCSCCGSAVRGWTVVDLTKGIGIGQEWSHDDAQCDAEERASEFNHVWINAVQHITDKEIEL